MGLPLRMIGAPFVDIADGDALYVGLAQKMKHDAQALGADADESDVHLVTGRHITRAPEHAARNNGNPTAAAVACPRNLRRETGPSEELRA